MGLAAFICIFLGVYPAPLYSILPYPVEFEPYTAFHVIGMLQLLMFGALAFAMLILSGYYPAEIRAANLDTDWFFRMPGRAFIRFCNQPLKAIGRLMDSWVLYLTARGRATPGASVQIEKQMDKFFHSALTFLPTLIFNWLRPFNTEISQLAWNLTYILIPFIILLLTILVLVI